LLDNTDANVMFFEEKVMPLVVRSTIGDTR